MHIDDDHMYYGAALTQIAEHPTFKAINALSFNGKKSRCAFLVNHDIGVYIKHDAVGPTGKKYPEFKFTFSSKQLHEIKDLSGRPNQRLFIVLVCLKAKEICVISAQMFHQLIELRKRGNDDVDESQYQILVRESEGKWFQVYVNKARSRGVQQGSRRIPRSDFPKKIFGTSHTS